MDTIEYLQPKHFFSVGGKSYADKFTLGEPLTDRDLGTTGPPGGYETLNRDLHFPYLFYWPSAEAVRSLLYVYSMAVCSFGPGHVISRSGKASYLLTLTYQGGGYLEYEGRTHLIRPGEVFLLDCRRPHRYGTHGANWGYYGVYFDGPPMDVYYSYLERNRQYVYPTEENSPLLLGLRQLFHINSERTFLTELENHNAMTYLLNEIVHIACAASAIPKNIQAIRGYLEKNYASHIDLDHLAETFFMSKYHLCRQFKRYIGVPPNAFLNQTRIGMAKYLLATANLSIGEIAAATGFHSTDHFLCLFRRQEGMTPSAFRRSHSLKESFSSNPSNK